MAKHTAHLMINGESMELRVLSGTIGPDVIALNHLATFPLFTFDPGYAATASCESKITYIDGEKGQLLYRGYPIDQLAEQCDYMETCHLLMHDELPSKKEKEQFIKTIHNHLQLPEKIFGLFSAFDRNAHPVAMMASIVNALAAHYYDECDIGKNEDRELAAMRLIAKMPTIAAACHRHNADQPFITPKEMDHAANFLNMMFAVPGEEKEPNPILSRALDRILTLHADHEQNASTSTVRLAGSTGTSPYSAVGAGIAALWGPAHGGANEASLKMLREIGDDSHIGDYIKRAKDKDDPFRLMGFGHRVYKNFDPRAIIMRNTCHEVLEELGLHDTPIFKLAMKLEKIALEDEYFIERKLYPNVDFYSGVTLNALGIPSSMFTAIFAMARTVGWISQWLEMMSKPHRIGRPRQLYTGPTQRDVPPMNKR